MTAVAPTLQAFFTDRLVRQRRVSPQTVASYRDTFRLLVRFVHDSHRQGPLDLEWDDLDAEVISTFSDHLEARRHNTARTRNLRLTAIRSLFRYAALFHPSTPPSSSGSSPSRPNALTAAPSPTSPPKRPLPSSTPPTRPAGRADETGRCSCSGCSAGCASPSSPGLIAPTWSSAPERTSAARAKDGSGASDPVAATRPGGPSGLAHRTRRHR